MCICCYISIPKLSNNFVIFYSIHFSPHNYIFYDLLNGCTFVRSLATFLSKRAYNCFGIIHICNNEYLIHGIKASFNFTLCYPKWSHSQLLVSRRWTSLISASFGEIHFISWLRKLLSSKTSILTRMNFKYIFLNVIFKIFVNSIVTQIYYYQTNSTVIRNWYVIIILKLIVFLTKLK